MDIFFEIHKNIPREGPGDDASTIKAYHLIPKLNQPKILDIGCGPGLQTLALAKTTDGTIIAGDIHQPFLDSLKRKLIEQKLSEKVSVTHLDMFDLSNYEDGSFDIIWSEGAVYIMGFEKGLLSWQNKVKTGGYIVVSELCWLKPCLNDELQAFWDEEYPPMVSHEDNLETIKRVGLSCEHSFVLPDSSWWLHYYTPLTKRVQELRDVYKDDSEAQTLLDYTMKEIEMHEKYSDTYGYVFYIIKKQ